ncbi:MAG: hypothetical protein PHF00_06335, partial [Elusimicrobia bacterium]|nr:hypothetical protein [Elusimicrobiota bacterium]
ASLAVVQPSAANSRADVTALLAGERLVSGGLDNTISRKVIYVIHAGGRTYALVDFGGVYIREGRSWKRLPISANGSSEFRAAGGRVFFRNSEGFYELSGENVIPIDFARNIGSEFRLFALEDGSLYAASSQYLKLFRLSEPAGIIENPPAAVQSLAAADGTLYAGTSDGLYRLKDGKWTKDYAARGKARVLGNGRELYAAVGEVLLRLGPGGKWIELLERPRRCTELLKVGGSIFAGIDDGSGRLPGLFELQGGAATQILPHYSSHLTSGQRLYVKTPAELLVLENGAASSPRLDEAPASRHDLRAAAEHSGSHFLATALGLYRSRGGGWKLLTRQTVRGMAADEDGVYLATWGGITRVATPPRELPWDWSAAVAAELGERIRQLQKAPAGPVAASAPDENGRIKDAGGRDLF